MIYHWKTGAYCTVIDELKAKGVLVKNHLANGRKTHHDKRKRACLKMSC
jgi:hypothetical protein